MSLLQYAPHFFATDVASQAHDFYGLTTTATILPSERDQNFHLATTSDTQYVLKIASAGQVIGYVTTGMKSPTLDKFVGMGYVPRALSAVGTEIDILVRGQPKRAKVVKRLPN